MISTLLRTLISALATRRNLALEKLALRQQMSLEKDCPEPRKVEPPDQGRIVAVPMIGGLHHRYLRLAA